MVLCAGAFGCYAAQGSLPGAQGQGYDLNLSYSRTTLKAVADAITQQVGIAFSYETALAGYPMENLEVSEKGATIEAILAAVFTPRGIDYRVVDKVVVLTRSTRPVPAASAAAKSEVKGVVRDAAGNPMIGVTVTIKGTLVGVSTGVDGGYAIPADGNATLLFSYIGYRPHEEVVGRRTQIDVTMQEDELVMDEVVVVGYGTLKKRNIVGAVENLSGDAVENRPNANITRSLQGQIPGPYKIPRLKDLLEWGKDKVVFNFDNKYINTRGVSDEVRRASLDYYIKQLQPGGDWSMYHNIMLSVRSVEEALYYWEHGIRNVMFCVEISSMEHFRAYDASPIPWKYIMAYIRLAVNPDLQPVYDLLHAEGVMTMTSITGSSDKVKNPYDRRVAYLRELVAEPDIIETDYPSEFIGLPWSRDAIHALQEAAMRSHRTNLK